VETSTVLAFRIFVMLSCLIIVPMAAIFGSAFPDVVKSVLVDRIVAWSSGKPYEPKPADESGGFSAVVAPTATSATAPNNWEAPRWGAGNSTAVTPQGTPGALASPGTQGPPGVPPQGGIVPVVATDAARATPAGHPPERPPIDMPYRNPPLDNPVASKQPYGAPGGPSPGVVADPTASAARGAPRPLESSDRFTAMERKLRDYGATYYLLETWGNDGEMYRFHCRMAIGNNPNYTRQFEATDHDSLKAMAQVLERVEAWRSGRLQ
jgi:hypothetical protein